MALRLDPIPLWPGVAPGSESWTQVEEVWAPPPMGPASGDTPAKALRAVRNVVCPTLTPVLPDPGASTGTGIVVCPGGGYFMLAIEHEGFEVAEWLADRGIAAFVLKYRVIETPAGPDGMAAYLAGLLSEAGQTGGSAPQESALSAILRGMEEFAPIPLEDGETAMTMVRDRAAEWGIRPDRLGAVGFSAGGRLVLDLATRPHGPVRPDFVGAIYAAVPKAPVPADAPPLFLAVAADDGLMSGTNEAFAAWRAAGRPAEVHIFGRGGHGFGMHKLGLPSDHWIDQFHWWIGSEGFLGEGGPR